MNTDEASLVYKFRPERTGFNMYAEYTRPQLIFLALHPCLKCSFTITKNTKLITFLNLNSKQGNYGFKL